MLSPPFCSLFGISSVSSDVEEAIPPSDPGDLGSSQTQTQVNYPMEVLVPLLYLLAQTDWDKCKLRKSAQRFIQEQSFNGSRGCRDEMMP